MKVGDRVDSPDGPAHVVAVGPGVVAYCLGPVTTDGAPWDIADVRLCAPSEVRSWGLMLAALAKEAVNVSRLRAEREARG